MIGLALYQLLKRAGLHQIPTSCLTMLLIFYYGLLTEFSVSTNRAVVMLTLSLVAVMIGRTYDLVSAMAFSAMIILFQTPLQLMNSGFLLSFGAVLGIAYLVPVFKELFPDKKKQNKKLSWILQIIKEGAIISFCTNLLTLPIILYYYYEFPLYGVIINILLIPFMSLLVILAMIGGILGCVYRVGGMFLMGGVHYILCIIELICQCFSKLPYHTVVIGQPSIILIILYYVILIAFIFCAKKYQKKTVSMILLLLMVVFIRFEDHKLQITLLDVGQGDGILIETPDESIYFIDGGSTDTSQVGKYRIEPYLKSSGIHKIDAVIITHGDEDHISGIREIMERGSIKIEVLIVPAVPLEQSGLLELAQLANKVGTKVVFIKKGDMIKNNKVKITCLHPETEFRSQSKNSYSTVLSLTYGTFDALLVGDLEADGENLLIDKLKEDRTTYDLLKVAHHGSKNSTSQEFLSIIKPKVAIISCGKKNGYGHPHKELLERLAMAKSKVFITTKSGAITIKTDGKTMKVNQYIKDEK